MNATNKVIDVSEYLIQLGFYEDKLLSNISLQKILYFAQGFHLATSDKVLFSEQIFAWEFGPVVKQVYHTYKKYGNNFLYPHAYTHSRSESILNNFSLQSKDLIDNVWNLFKDYAPFELVNMTHAIGSPWHDIYEKFEGRIPKDIEIDINKMNAYFKTLLV